MRYTKKEFFFFFNTPVYKNKRRMDKNKHLYETIEVIAGVELEEEEIVRQRLNGTLKGEKHIFTEEQV
ncbi:hypothetical protein PGB90_000001 [Kerria lacca]